MAKNQEKLTEKGEKVDAIHKEYTDLWIHTEKVLMLRWG